MSLLIIGGTGTLGRQIVRIALNQGFQVRCLVRSFRKASFLKEWGAEIVYGDLKLPETIPLIFYGITAIIDASTVRINDLSSIKSIDLVSKYILIESAKKARIKHYIFFSFINSYEYSDIPLIKLKLMVEKKLIKSGLPYTIFHLSGFFQGLINQYAVPILDQQSIWVTSESKSIAYINTQDIAKFVIKSLSITECKGLILPLVGQKAWTSSEVIKLCEKISGRRAQISKVSIYIIQICRQVTTLFEWSWNISDRLAFIEMLSKGDNFYISVDKILFLLQFSNKDIESLEEYLQEYFQKIMNKIKKLNNPNNNSIMDINNFNF